MANVSEMLNNDLNSVAAQTFFEQINAKSSDSAFGIIADSWTFHDVTVTSSGPKSKTSANQSARNVKRNLRALGSATYDLGTFRPADESECAELGIDSGFVCVGEFEQMKMVNTLTVALGFSSDKVSVIGQVREAKKADNLDRRAV